MCNSTIKDSIKRFKLIFLCIRNAYSFATTIYLTYVLYWSSYLRKGFEWGYIASIVAYVFLTFTFFSPKLNSASVLLPINSLPNGD